MPSSMTLCVQVTLSMHSVASPTLSMTMMLGLDHLLLSTCMNPVPRCNANSGFGVFRLAMLDRHLNTPNNQGLKRTEGVLKVVRRRLRGASAWLFWAPTVQGSPPSCAHWPATQACFAKVSEEHAHKCGCVGSASASSAVLPPMQQGLYGSQDHRYDLGMTTKKQKSIV